MKICARRALARYRGLCSPRCNGGRGCSACIDVFVRRWLMNMTDTQFVQFVNEVRMARGIRAVYLPHILATLKHPIRF